MAKPLISAISYSGGVQSEWMVWMVLLGLIPRTDRMVVLTADPGMEHSQSAAFVERMGSRCQDAKLPFVRAAGQDLLADLLGLKSSRKSRIDNPPFWTSRDGKLGKLTQGCTQHYKIEPIDRAIRRWVRDRWGVGLKNSAWLAEGSVEKWIGFTADEQHRADGLVKFRHAKCVRYRFPLIEAGLTKTDVVNEFLKRNLPIPPRSMCVACPYHGLRSLKEMHDERPDDWATAVAVDETVRDLTQIRVTAPCYVSQTLIPLRQLATQNFELANPVATDLAQCPSGACFI